MALLAIPATASASTPCWKDVIADWSKDNAVDGHYSPACIRQAMVDAPADLKIYSSLEDDLQSALRARSARRLTGAHRAAAASIAAPDGSSTVSPLVVVLGGLGLMAVMGTGALIVHRRRADR